MAVIVSGGTTITTSSSGPWSTPFEWSGAGGNAGHPLLDMFRGCQYEALYEQQPSVNKVIDKRARLQGLVPLNAHERTDTGPVPIPGSGFGRLVSKPCAEMSQFEYRDWMFHTKDIHGIAFGWLVRDDPARRSGGVLEVSPLHPQRMRFGKNERKSRVFHAGRLTASERASGKSWWFVVDESTEVHIPRRDLLIWRNFHPSLPHWGLSKLDPLRSTLEDDAAARCAMEAMWKRGMRPHYVIKSDDDFSNHPAIVQQIKDDAEASHGGVGNWWHPMVLDGGASIDLLPSESGLEYLGLRKLTDVEVGAVFDMSGPVIHNLERATFNNIYEIFQDTFKSSLGYDLRSFEAAWENDVRDGTHGEPVAPNFPDGQQAKFNLKGVLRGSPEKQINSYSTQIQTGQRTINEIRGLDDLAPIEGGDVLLVNAALIPVQEAGQQGGGQEDNLVALPGGDVPLSTQARAARGRPVEVEVGRLPVAALSAGLSGREAAQKVFGILSRVDSVGDVPVDRLVEGLTKSSEDEVRRAVAVALLEDAPIEGLREMVRGLEFPS